MTKPKTLEEISYQFEAIQAAEFVARARILKPKRGIARLLKTDTGKVVTHGQVLQGILKQAELDAEVQDGKRPRLVRCETCRGPVAVGPIGPFPRWCALCRIERCSKCSKEITRSKKNSGLCRSCSMARRNARLSAEEKSSRGRKGARAQQASMTDEQKRAMYAKAVANMQAALTPDDRRRNLGKTTSAQRSAAGKLGAAARNAAMSPETLRDNLARARACRTRDEMRETGRKGAAIMNAARTRESRADAGRKGAAKGWATRRANAAARAQAERG